MGAGSHDRDPCHPRSVALRAGQTPTRPFSQLRKLDAEALCPNPKTTAAGGVTGKCDDKGFKVSEKKMSPLVGKQSKTYVADKIEIHVRIRNETINILPH